MMCMWSGAMNANDLLGDEAIPGEGQRFRRRRQCAAELRERMTRKYFGITSGAIRPRLLVRV